MNFERGLDPKIAMGTGWKSVFDSMENCLLVTEADLYQRATPHHWHNLETVQLHNISKQRVALYEAFVIIVVIGNEFKFLKNRFMIHPIIDYKVYKIEKLPVAVFRIKEEYDKWINGNDENVD